MALRGYIEQGLLIDFEGGAILMRHYDEEKELWFSNAAPNLCPKREYPKLVLQDDIIKAKMKRQNKIDAVLELDMAYLNKGISDKKYDRPMNAKLILLVDNVSGAVVGQEILAPDKDQVQAILNIFINFIMQYGKMNKICVRNPYIISIIEDLCKECDITIKKSKKLKALDMFLYEFRGHL